MNKLNLIDKAFFLKKTPLFAELDLNLLLAISEKLQTVSLDEKTSIFHKNEEASRMYFIVKGSVFLFNEDKKKELHTEDFFGEEALFNEKGRAYSALATTDVTLLTLSRTHLLTIISECPTVATGLLQVYTTLCSFR